MADSNVTCMGGWQSDIIHTCEVVALARPTRGGTHLPGDCLAGPWLLRGRTRIVLRRRFRAPETIFSRSHHGWPWPPFGVEVQRHVIRFYRRQLIIPRVIVSVPLRAQVPLSSTRRAAVSARRTFAYPTAMTTPRGKSKNVAQARLLGILMLKTLCQSQ